MISVGLSAQAWAGNTVPREAIVEVFAALPNSNMCDIGTGWFINDHQVVTNFHVIGDGARFYIKDFDQATRTATVHGFNHDCDLALLDVSPRPDQRWFNLIPDSDNIPLGERVGSLGYPRENFQPSSGVITRTYSTGGRQIAAFYSDMPIDHGASGSPVLNAKGEVIGVVEAVITDKTGRFVECEIISANVVWEALQIANKSIHPRGFKTGVTIGLNFLQDGLEPSRDVENPANSIP